MVVADVDVEDMYRPVERCASIEEVVDNSIPAALFACKYHIDYTAFCASSAFVSAIQRVHPTGTHIPVVESFRSPFNPPVAIEHVQYPVISVKSSVLRLEFGVHSVVGGGVEIVNLRLRDGGAGEANIGASAERDDGVGV